MYHEYFVTDWKLEEDYVMGHVNLVMVSYCCAHF